MLELSILYRAGMFIHAFNVSIIPAGSMPYGVGPSQSASAHFQEGHLDRLAPIRASPAALKAAHGLQAFYRQSTKVGRLALGWMLLEELFGDTSGYPHILNKTERRELEKLINDILSVDVGRKRRLIEGFNNRNSFRTSRNELMAERIAKLRNEDQAAVVEVVRGVSEARGNVLHTFKAEDEIDISQWDCFIEDTVLRYIVQESGVGVIRLRGE